MEYEVEITYYDYGATETIDNISERVGFTAEDYVNACMKNADKEWCNLLKEGVVRLRSEAIKLTDKRDGNFSKVDAIDEIIAYLGESYADCEDIYDLEDTCSANGDTYEFESVEMVSTWATEVTTEEKDIYVVLENSCHFPSQEHHYTYDLEEALRKAEYLWNHLTPAAQKVISIYVHRYELIVDPELDAEVAFHKATENMCYPAPICVKKFAHSEKKK